jgi:PAS domain S-box-containing protein
MKRAELLRRIAIAVSVAAVYFAAGKLGLILAFVNASATAVWAPTGIALAALIVLGIPAVPGVLLGAFAVNATITGLTPTTVGIAVGNTLEAFVGAWLVNRFANDIHAFERPQDIFRFTVLAGLFSTTVSATIGVASLVLGGFAAMGEVEPVWLTWWLGDAVGALLVTPVLVLWAARPRFSTIPKRLAEAALLLGLTMLIAFAVFGGWRLIGTGNDPLEFLILPVLIWSAFRFGQRESATLSLVLAGVAIWGTLSGYGPFVIGSPNTSLVLLQSFMALIAITMLALAAEVTNRRKIELALRSFTTSLEQQVEEQAVSLSGAQENLRLYADIIRHIPLGVVVLHLEKPDDLSSLRIVSVNPNAIALAGIKAEDYVGKYLVDVNPRQFGADAPKLFADVIKSGDARELGELPNTDPRIPAEYFAAKIFPLPNQRVAITFEDISVRKRTEEALRKQRELYNSLLQAQSDLGEGVSITQDNRFVYVNEALARLSGYSVDELLAMPSTFNLIAPEAREHLRESHNIRAAGAQIPEPVETLAVHKDGHRINIDYAVKLILHGDMVQLFSIMRDVTDRKKAEKALRTSEERFRLLIEGVKDYAIFTIDPAGVVLSWNPAAEKIYGYRAEEIIGQNISKVYTHEDQSRGMLQHELALTVEQGSYEVEAWRVRKDGSLFWSNILTSPIRDESGNLKAFVRICRDITQRKRAEERFRGVLESAPDALLIVDREGKIQIVNTQVEKIFGYRREELLGKPIEMLIPERFREQHQLHRADYALSPRARTMGSGLQLYGLHRNKYEFPIDVSLSPLETDEGTLFTAAVRDTTLRKRQEKELQESEEKLRLVFAGVEDYAIYLLDPKGCVVSWNEGAERLYGYTSDEITGQNVTRFYTSEDQASARPELALETARKQGRFESEELRVRKDATRFLAHSITTALRDENGNLKGFARISQNITERKRTEEEIKQSREALRTLASRLVDSQEIERRRLARELHDEFGQLLTGLKMQLETAAHMSADQLRKELREAESQVSQLIAQTRNMSLELSPTMLDDLGLLPALLTQIDRYSAQTKVKVDFKQSGLEDKRFPSKVETAAYRVVQEALTNVARYAKVKQASVRVMAHDGALSLQVEDKGIGFDPEAALAMASSSGLVGMRERILAVGGQLSMESSPGRGTRIIAQIPLEDGHAADANPRDAT